MSALGQGPVWRFVGPFPNGRPHPIVGAVDRQATDGTGAVA